MNEFADWTRGFALLGWDGSGYVPVGVNADGKLEIVAMGEDAGGDALPLLVDASGRVIMVAYGTINVAGTSTVTQVDKDREVQGADGATLRTLAVDANGQLIMVPRGQGGNYMAVDAAGNLAMVAKGMDGASDLQTLAVDTSGRIIMVPYGTTTVAGTATVTQTDSSREVQGVEGETLRTLAVDANGQLIMVPRGQGGNYLTIDSDGYMTTVIKGDDAGMLRTVALDAEGRLSAYIIDSSDAWGTFLAVGNAELAVRLGSPVVFHPSGRVVWMETWENGLARWTTGGAGTGNSVALAVDSWASGGYSAKLIGGSTSDYSAYILRRFSWLPASSVGISLAYCAPGLWDRSSIQMYRADGSYVHEPGLQIGRSNSNLAVLVPDYGYVFVLAAAVGTGSLIDYNEVKLTVDMVNHKYGTLWFKGGEYDLSYYSYPYSAGADSPTALCYFRHYSRPGYNEYIYLDNIIYTVAEE